MDKKQEAARRLLTPLAGMELNTIGVMASWTQQLERDPFNEENRFDAVRGLMGLMIATYRDSLQEPYQLARAIYSTFPTAWARFDDMPVPDQVKMPSFPSLYNAFDVLENQVGMAAEGVAGKAEGFDATLEDLAKYQQDRSLVWVPTEETSTQYVERIK